MTRYQDDPNQKMFSDEHLRKARRNRGRLRHLALARRRSPQRTLLELMLRRLAHSSARPAIGWTAATWIGLVALDGMTGPHYSFNSMYLMLLCVTTWCFGRIAGLASGALAIAATLYLNGFGDGLSSQESSVPAFAAAWNASMRGVAVIFIILLVGAFRRTFDQEQANALIDPLTGLGNRRLFEQDCKRQELAAQRDRLILLCGVIDLDDFKAVNDQHGHAAGDDVLRVVAQALSTAVRPYDVTARIGGDEFAFCLTVPDDAAGQRKAGRIHEVVMAAMEASQWAATCSLGAATGIDAKQALHVADKVMYGAKSSKKSSWLFESQSNPSR
ncbi:diguanylate cyclase [Sphingomonas aerolata]|uniref:GGDEF domain-containing protein n=1 Tax=Sphingomonas aerolata TaxID=185951 RepID=UPI0033447DD3